MKKLFPFFILFISNQVVFGQLKETREVTPFDKIRVSGKISVFLLPAEKETLAIEITGIDSEKIITEVDKRTLVIKPKGILTGNSEINVYVSYRKLRDLRAALGAMLEFGEVLTGEHINMEVTSDGYIVASIETESIDAKVVSGGRLELSGTTDILEVSANTGGVYYGYDLGSNKAFVNSGSGARAEVAAGKLLEANASSGGKIYYRGLPAQIVQKATLGGEIIKE
ncbi:MAG: head GIN domain-containing protein [Cyclobacteriaceae bacterium]